MTAKKIVGLCLALMALLTGCKKETEMSSPPLTANQQSLVEELNALAVSFSNNPLALTDDKLSFLNSLASARIVGLGEATHGSKEFFEAKHRIFKYMAESFNHKLFGFECDFAESLYIDAYIRCRRY